MSVCYSKLSLKPDTLSPAERFMREMMPLQNAAQLLSVMFFKRQFGEQVDGIYEALLLTMPPKLSWIAGSWVGRFN